MQSAVRRIVSVGVQVMKKVTMKQEDVAAFGNLIGDHNPIHSDLAAAKAAGFPSTICYGMFAGSLFSGLMATELPGPNTVYISQNLRFLAPVFVGDELEIIAKVTQFRRDRGLIEMATIVQKKDPTDENKRITCVDGFAVGLNKTVEFKGESTWKTR
ncbi:putative mitochondrial Maoc family dehydratase-like protein [Leptomonas pyrrhocoris]|uniref:Putative mitochondrial Maoc family dehydratase-like protein n=1 Tax=Leptomonas pyrrhocoris TaxID=157538 RepID=A0A0M9FR40_LEPPY|nr:putative mitochondrial Maoc family dehydratase-like protein [Leptomonas pyrrhocoris]XP_015652785.1 putative mitochondrial Maoc family dehydratase-like protein [Leptomonas pyrrhocoris]KPA74345.1 putative mitochondrial Maoc family dehydratase-like protein [Leptomonas pyrrhocoris]KPA74346.1 putative mitochondrial Maoc family dehydratase-like protein [Leptomonas pyrrhocoris]|eukprot:XP_015652784.1 putative mitochondrial Maoc family dehydratase-like protein [Leptomonas pyrrhocoris]